MSLKERQITAQTLIPNHTPLVCYVYNEAQLEEIDSLIGDLNGLFYDFTGEEIDIDEMSMDQVFDVLEQCFDVKGRKDLTTLIFYLNRTKEEHST